MTSYSLHTKLLVVLQLSLFLYINTFHVKESAVLGRISWRRNSILQAVTDGEDLDFKDEVAEDIIPSVLKRAFATSVQPVEDIAKLDVDDPSFANVVWPSERDERSKAMANHLLWRREQTNDARDKWLQWGVYRRLGNPSIFQFSVEDYITQNLLLEIESNIDKAVAAKESEEADEWRNILNNYKLKEIEAVKRTMNAFYGSFNRKEKDEIRMFWLPDETSECMIPGFPKATGPNQIYKLFKDVFETSEPFGNVIANNVLVRTAGNVAVVVTIEEIAQAATKKKLKIGANNKVKLISLTVLRHSSKQWRIWTRHTSTFATSKYTNNALNVKSVPSMAKHRIEAKTVDGRTEIENLIKEKLGILPVNSDRIITKTKQGDILYDLSEGSVGKLFGVSRKMPSGKVELGDKSKTKKESNTAVIKDTFGMDIEDNLCRLTVQALRYLYKIGKISMEDKDDLIAYMIDSIADDRKSSVETAFQIIFGKSLKNTSEEKISKNLKEFSEQCAIILQKLRMSTTEDITMKSKSNTKKSQKKKGSSLLSITNVPKLSNYFDGEDSGYDDEVDEEDIDAEDDYEEEEEDDDVDDNEEDEDEES